MARHCWMAVLEPMQMQVHEILRLRIPALMKT
jgi:hypothetical protein